MFTVDRALIDAINAIDPSITIATVAEHAAVAAGQMVATVKIIPFAVASALVGEVTILCEGREAFAVHAFQPKRVGFIQTMLPGIKPSVLDKTTRVTQARLSRSGSVLSGEKRTAHDEAELAAAIADSAADSDLLLVFGASAVSDAADVIPAAIRKAGGRVERFGMPVDPGNLLVIGSVGAVAVLGAPGCARSPKENGFDWVLNRILAGETPTVEQLTGLGVGGLLMEIPTRPLPRLATSRQGETLRVAAVVLAAGSASRMAASGSHKLLAEFDGVPLIRRSVETVLAANVERAVVVTGYRADDVEKAIGELDVAITRNHDFATGMASSLRAGLQAVRKDADGLLVMLADMPAIRAEHLNVMIEAFRSEKGRAIVRAVSAGKRGNPVILPATTFEAISKLTGDIGARPVIERSGLPVIDVDIGDAAHVDTDTPEDIMAAGGKLAG
jgi:molybdenum cofactor cytidylyltransferase